MKTHNILTIESLSWWPTTNNKAHSYDARLNSYIEYHNAKSGNPICRLHILTEANFIFNPDKILSTIFQNFIDGKSVYRQETRKNNPNYNDITFNEISNLYEIHYLNNQLSGEFKLSLDNLFTKVQMNGDTIKKITNSFFN